MENLRFFELQWNPIDTVTNGPKKFGLINEGFFLQENVWQFLPGNCITKVAIRQSLTVRSFP